MKKTMMTLLAGLMFSLAGNAQVADRLPFGKDKIFASASLSGLGVTYNKNEKWNFGMQGKVGYFFEDDWMLYANAGFEYRHLDSNLFYAGGGLRYYIEQNGLFLGASCNYEHKFEYDDVLPSVQLGYAFFLNRTVTIEPELFYKQSLKCHTDYSTFGLRVGIGIYFE